MSECECAYLRLEVAVHQAPLAKRKETARELAHHDLPQPLVDARERRAAQQRRKVVRAALEHHEGLLPRRVRERKEAPHHVRVLDRAHDLDLGLEAPSRLLAQAAGVHHLDGHRLERARVLAVIHDGKRATAQLLAQIVAILPDNNGLALRKHARHRAGRPCHEHAQRTENTNDSRRLVGGGRQQTSEQRNTTAATFRQGFDKRTHLLLDQYATLMALQQRRSYLISTSSKPLRTSSKVAKFNLPALARHTQVIVVHCPLGIS